MNETEWTQRIAERRTQMAEMAARLAAGEDEVTLAREYGTQTRNDVNAKVAAVFAARKS